MGEHVVRRGEPRRPFPRTFEQRPTTKLDSDELRRLLATADPVVIDLNPDIEIVTPMLDDVLPREPAVIVAAPVEPDPIPAVVVVDAVPSRWPRLVFALAASAWIAMTLLGL
ncbi:MAG TPA: hypothetical protein VGO00_14405 [Kofleriaceae bacterium]|jgi:hypothetical protein|nr:hypothetical protein [Kofleriaceae bacterium]